MARVTVSQQSTTTVEDVAFYQELGRLVAGDVHWMMQRIDIPNLVWERDPQKAPMPDTRYYKFLQEAARDQIERLESELSWRP